MNNWENLDNINNLPDQSEQLTEDQEERLWLASLELREKEQDGVNVYPSEWPYK